MGKTKPTDPKLPARYRLFDPIEELPEREDRDDPAPVVRDFQTMTQVDSAPGGDLLGNQFRNSLNRGLARCRGIDKVFACFITQHFVVVEVEVIMRQRRLLLTFHQYAQRPIPFRAGRFSDRPAR